MKSYKDSFRNIPGQTQFIDFNITGKFDSESPKVCLNYLGSLSRRMRLVLDALDSSQYCIRTGFNKASIKLLEFENIIDDIITEPDLED